MAKNRAMTHWDVDDSIELYGIRNWGAGFFDVNKDGAVVICPQGPKGPQIPMPEVIAGLHERGYDMPVLLRVENILASRITASTSPSGEPSKIWAMAANIAAFSPSRSTSNNRLWKK